MALTDKLAAIGDAIRLRTGGVDKLTLAEMPEAIAGIPSGGSGEGGGTVRYVVGTPVAFRIADWDADAVGHTYTLPLTGYKVGANGAQLGLMPASSSVNTQAVVEAALTIVSGNRAGATSLTLSAVNIPKGDLTVAVFGLEARE